MPMSRLTGASYVKAVRLFVKGGCRLTQRPHHCDDGTCGGSGRAQQGQA
ncbi:MAG: hypothetical protein AB2695_06220 [Candidatus Thiodiazotropha endolucinida]